jgi:hypothetical protein
MSYRLSGSDRGRLWKYQEAGNRIRIQETGSRRKESGRNIGTRSEARGVKNTGIRIQDQGSRYEVKETRRQETGPRIKEQGARFGSRVKDKGARGRKKYRIEARAPLSR